MMTISVNQVPGLGPKTAEYLAQQGITTAETLLDAGLTVLIAAPGFGDGRARKVLDAAASLVVDAEKASPLEKKPGKLSSDKKKKTKSGKKRDLKKGDKKKKQEDKKKKGAKKKPSKGKPDNRKKSSKKKKKGKK
jgi:hypothetical protein